VASLKNINQIDALPYHNVYVEKLKRLKKSGNFLNIQNSANNKIHEIAERLREFKLKVIVGG
jgi:hypothetical protein